jgi:hypothetical protein
MESASERDQLERMLNHAEDDQKLYMKEITVPKNIDPSASCAAELGPSIAIADVDDPLGMRVSQVN